MKSVRWLCVTVASPLRCDYSFTYIASSGLCCFSINSPLASAVNHRLLPYLSCQSGKIGELLFCLFVCLLSHTLFLSSYYSGSFLLHLTALIV